MGGAHENLIPERLIAVCGLYCASCPAYARGECAGCRTLPETNRCYCAHCAQQRGLAYCAQCADFPCDTLLSNEKATLLSPLWLAWQRTRKQDDQT